MSSIFEPWLAYDGTEIGNGTRVMDYLENIGIPKVEIGTNQDCNCEHIDDGPYTDPEVDAAPWFEPTYPLSAHFLGFWPESIEIPPSWRRRVAQRSGGGANLGSAILGGRVAVVSGTMYATSALGMQWGERWLSEVLRCGCADCGLGDLCVLPACPPSGIAAAEADGFFRILRGSGIVDGPHFEPVVANRCAAQRVVFTMGSRYGYLFGEPVLECSGTLASGS